MTQEALTILRIQLQRAKPFFPHAASLLFVGLLGWLNGYLLAGEPTVVPSLKDTWALPNWSPSHADSQLSSLVDVDMWGEKKATPLVKSPAAANQRAWHFVGTTHKGTRYLALIELGDGTEARLLAKDDELPSGEKILAVENGVLRVDADGEQQVIETFKPEKK